MSDSKQELVIRQELIKLIRSHSDNIKVAKVLSVDLDKKTCSVQILDNDLTATVRLRASEDGSEKGFWCVPKIASTVVVGKMVQFNRHVLLMITEAESFTFNEGSFGGLVKSEVVAEEINKLKSEINELKTLLSSWVVAPGDGGRALKTVISTWAGQQLEPSLKADFENQKIKHG
jgi:hypothetical protein